MRTKSRQKIYMLFPQVYADCGDSVKRWKLVTFDSQTELEEMMRLNAHLLNLLGQREKESSLTTEILMNELSLEFKLVGIDCSKDGQHRTIYIEIPETETDKTCRKCGGSVVVNKRYPIRLKHVPSGNVRQSISLVRIQYCCPHCGAKHIQEIPFRDADHRITKYLREFIESLLRKNTFTYLQIAELTGVDKNIIIEINDKRLKGCYTENGAVVKPQSYSRYLCIDEFLLHKGKKYATIIIDYQTGQVLWAQIGKKKQVVYDFVEHVGEDWMNHVEAVACDMNSDFEEGFVEKCPHIKIVNDHYHLIKNFNEMVIDRIRKDLVKEVKALGDEEGVELLKRTKFLLCSRLQTLIRKDREACGGKVIRKANPLFKGEQVTRKGGNVLRYDAICAKFPIFNDVFIIRSFLDDLYKATNLETAESLFADMLIYCLENTNNRLYNFGLMLTRHKEGIINHALYQISSGKIEGINQRIKTMRRTAYGLPNDERFFLRLMDLHGPREAAA